MGKNIKILTKYKTKAEVPKEVQKRYHVIPGKEGIYISAYVSNKAETAALEQLKYQELTGQKVNFVKEREKARANNTGYSDKIKAESKVAVEKAQAKIKAQEQKKLYETISSRMEAKKKAKQTQKPTSKATPNIGTIQKQKQTTAKQIGVAYSTLTPQQERDYGIITQKQYEQKIKTTSKLKKASKIYEKVKFIQGDVVAKGLEKSSLLIKKGEIERQKGIERQSELVKATKLFSYGSLAEEIAIGLYTSPVDLPFAVGEVITKQVTTTVASIKYPSQYKQIRKEQIRALKEGTIETLKDPKTYFQAAVFALVPSIKVPNFKTTSVKPQPKPQPKPQSTKASLFDNIRKDKRTTPKPKTQPKTGTEKQFFTDIKTTRDPITKKTTLTAIGERTGLRQTVTKEQVRNIISGKKAQARSPFGRIDEIILKRKETKAKSKKPKTKEKSKDIIKTQKDIIKIKKPKERSGIIISKPRKISKKSKSKDKDIIKTKDKDIIPQPKPSKDIIKTPSKDIIPQPKPSKDIIKTPSKDIVPKPKPPKKSPPKKETLLEKAKSKRRATPFAFPNFDIDLGGSGGSGFVGRRSKRVTGRKTGYKASLVAETLGIYGTAPTRKQFTGYEFRPLLKEDKKKKKKKEKIY